MKMIRWAFVLLAAGSGCLWADVLLKENFEQKGKWTSRTDGKSIAELVEGGVEGKCLMLSCKKQGLAYYTIKLDPSKVRGKTLVIRAMVKTKDVVQGPQVYSTAKFHVGGRVGKTHYNRAKWFTGTSDWHEEVLRAPIPDDIEQPVFDLAIQNAKGTAWFDNLLIDDGLAPQMALDLKPVANTSYSDGVAEDGAGGFLDTGSIDFRNVPTGEVELGGCHFYVMRVGENDGATCVALRGLKRPKLPLEPAPVRRPGKPKPEEALVKVGQKGKRLLFLQAAGWVDANRSEPCLVCTVRYADGKTEKILMREGVDVGPFDAPEDLANWKVVWKDRRGSTTVGLGVSEWKNPRPEVEIESLKLRTPGKGAAPIIVAITLDRKGP